MKRGIRIFPFGWGKIPGGRYKMCETIFCEDGLDLDFQDACDCCGKEMEVSDYFEEPSPGFDCDIFVKVMRKDIQTGKVFESLECCNCVVLTDEEYQARKTEMIQKQIAREEAIYNEQSEGVIEA